MGTQGGVPPKIKYNRVRMRERDTERGAFVEFKWLPPKNIIHGWLEDVLTETTTATITSTDCTTTIGDETYGTYWNIKSDN